MGGKPSGVQVLDLLLSGWAILGPEKPIQVLSTPMPRFPYLSSGGDEERDLICDFFQNTPLGCRVGAGRSEEVEMLSRQEVTAFWEGL